MADSEQYFLNNRFFFWILLQTLLKEHITSIPLNLSIFNQKNFKRVRSLVHMESIRSKITKFKIKTFIFFVLLLALNNISIQ